MEVYLVFSTINGNDRFVKAFAKRESAEIFIKEQNKIHTMKAFYMQATDIA